jgi:hypothetical protein
MMSIEVVAINLSMALLLDGAIGFERQWRTSGRVFIDLKDDHCPGLRASRRR